MCVLVKRAELLENSGILETAAERRLELPGLRGKREPEAWVAPSAVRSLTFGP